LVSAQEMTFHVLSKKGASEDEIVDLILNLDDYSKAFGVGPELDGGSESGDG